MRRDLNPDDDTRASERARGARCLGSAAVPAVVYLLVVVIDGDGRCRDGRRWRRRGSAPLVARRSPPAAGSGAVFQGVCRWCCGVAIEDGTARAFVYFFFSLLFRPFPSGLPRKLCSVRPIRSRLCTWTQAH
jgi:hypothetical protein